MHVVTIEVPHLRNRTHLVHDGRVGVVIDPPRQVGAVEAAAEEAGVDIVAVAETHIHDDYVSGGLFLSKRHRAAYLVAADEEVDFDRIEVHDNETLAFGDIDLRAIATPGHTPLHLAFLASDATTRDDSRGALFSGGSLLHGTVGRTDLVDPVLTPALTRAQWLSAHRLGALPAETFLHPTHGSGGFGAGTATPAVDGMVTVGDQRSTNPALTLGHERFVSKMLGSLDPGPSHHTQVSARNRAGAWSPRPHHRIDADGLGEALARGAHVIDVRSAADYAAGHIPGTLSVPSGPRCAVCTGWVTPWVRSWCSCPTPTQSWSSWSPTSDPSASRMSRPPSSTGPVPLAGPGCAVPTGPATSRIPPRPEAWSSTSPSRRVVRRTPPGSAQHPCPRAPAPAGGDPARQGVGALRRRVPRGSGGRDPRPCRTRRRARRRRVPRVTEIGLHLQRGRPAA